MNRVCALVLPWIAGRFLLHGIIFRYTAYVETPWSKTATFAKNFPNGCCNFFLANLLTRIADSCTLALPNDVRRDVASARVFVFLILLLRFLFQYSSLSSTGYVEKQLSFGFIYESVPQKTSKKPVIIMGKLGNAKRTFDYLRTFSDRQSTAGVIF